MLFAYLPQIALTQTIRYHGAPHIQNFEPNSETDSKFIWSICQDYRGILFFGDGEGVIEYDGTSWRRHPVPNKSAVKSLATDSTGTIYVGGNNDFGYLKPDSIGSLKYHSLNHLVPGNTPYYRSVWKIFITHQGVYYISQNKIFRLINDKVEVIPVNLEPPGAAFANGIIYLVEKTMGMVTIDGNQFKPLPNYDVKHLRKNGYFFVNSLSDDEVLISFSRTDHFYKYNTSTYKLDKIDLPKQTALFLRENFGFDIINLDNGIKAIGTSKSGIAILNTNWEITSIINEEWELISNSVYSLFFDMDKNLWAAHAKGVSRIDITYPMILYCKKQGIENDVTATTVHNGIQYIGTEDKCFYLPPYQFSLEDDNHKALQIKKLRDCHQFLDVNGHLLLCNWASLSEINKNVVQHIYNKEERIYCAAYDKRYPDKIAIGQNEKVVICTFKDNGTDNFIELKSTFDINDKLSQIRSMVFDDQGKLWLASYNEGISCIKFNSNDLTDYTVIHFTENNGLPKEIQNAYVNNFNGNINIFTPKGIYKPIPTYNKLGESSFSFSHDARWGKTFTQDSCAVKIAKQISTNQFFIHGDKTGILKMLKDSVVFDYKPFLKLNNIRSASIADNRFINIGGVGCFGVYDTWAKKNVDKSFEVLIRKVSILPSDSLVFNGSYLSPDGKSVVLSQSKDYVPILANNLNSLRFHFSANYLESPLRNQYRYMVEGFDKDWSTWSTEPSATYTNIPYGAYTFKVMGKNLYDTQSPVSTYKFYVKPAWYQTEWAYLLYFIISVLFIILIVKLYSRNLSRKNLTLERLVQIRTGELQETVYKLKDTQSSLMQQEKMASLGILTAGVAHEINNPLNYILGGYTGLQNYFEDKNELDEEVEMLLDSIKVGVDRAAEIVSGLNQFSRTRKSLDERCDIHSILDNSILMIQHLLNNRIELIKNLHAESCIVMGNVGELHQVFINILINACQAIPNSGTIRVTTGLRGSHLKIIVFDNGMGIEQDNLNKITDPFFTTKEAGQGTGLGLYISYKIVKEHKGQLTIRSKPGAGTHVIISLPLAQ